jgi:membrane peptidoglycan carboxypeptidase
MRMTEVLSRCSDRAAELTIHRSAKRYSTELNTPEHFVEMLLLIEDKRFPYHFGVDPFAIFRAVIFNIQGGVLQGASTIVQQLYNVHMHRRSMSRKPRTLRFKVRQCIWALYHSSRESKGALLREYVDRVYWGQSLYGLDEAAHGYFNIGRLELSPAQSFFLAERIAMPNRCSEMRILNLIRRPAIRNVLARYGATAKDVETLYARIYDFGGEMWQLQVR